MAFLRRGALLWKDFFKSFQIFCRRQKIRFFEASLKSYSLLNGAAVSFSPTMKDAV